MWLLQEQMSQEMEQEMAQELCLKTTTKPERLGLSGEEGQPTGFFSKGFQPQISGLVTSFEALATVVDSFSFHMQQGFYNFKNCPKANKFHSVLIWTFLFGKIFGCGEAIKAR